MTATIWRTCPSCFGSFEQPDDPGRKRVYCSRACQQAAYRARQRHSSGRQRSRPPGLALESPRAAPPARRVRAARRRPAPPAAPGAARTSSTASAGRRQDSANGHRPGATGGDDLSRIQRIIAALLRKAAATSFPHEAAACREKAEALRVKYGL